jgi:hypothetical protein
MADDSRGVAVTKNLNQKLNSKRIMIGAYITFAVAVGIVLTYVAVLRHFLNDADKPQSVPQVRTALRQAAQSDLQEALLTH